MGTAYMLAGKALPDIEKPHDNVKEPTLITTKSCLLVVKGIHTKSTPSLSMTSSGAKTDFKMAADQLQCAITTKKE